MDLPSPFTPRSALDVLEKLAKTRPGYRRAHARGIATRGSFVASPGAKALTTAAHFQGGTIPCVVRFSNSAANPFVPDTGSPTEGTVLGLAVRFALPDGGVATWAGINLRAFVAATPEEFVRFALAQKVGATGKPSLLKIGIHVLTHLHALPGVKSAKSLKPSPNFSVEDYGGLHTYFFVDAAGKKTPFRYRWVPRDVEAALSPEAVGARPPQYLLDALRDRLGRGPVVFDLVAQLAGPDDDLLHANVLWPDERQVVQLGTLTIDRVHEDPREAELLVFDPGNVPPGIETSDDPILAFRSKIYGESYGRRSTETRVEPPPADLGQ